MIRIVRTASLLLVLAACQQAAPQHDERIPPTPANDVEFIDSMVPHHTMALDMASRELAAGSDTDVKAFAQRVVDAQQAEIAQLKAVRTELAGSDVVPPLDDARMEAAMMELHGASGPALDELFLEMMIPHHAGAIQLADRAKPSLSRTDLRALAEKIIDDQSREIGEIRSLQDR